MIDEYLKNPDTDHVKDMQRFIVHKGSRPPLTTRNYMQTMIAFLSFHEINLTRKQEKQIKSKIPKGKVRTVKKDLDIDNLKKILIHCDALTRAVILTLISSGMRIGECLQLTFADIDIKIEPAEIMIRGEYTKSGDQRVTFLSGEAVQAIIEWMKVRDQYIESARNKNRGLIAAGISRQRDESILKNQVFPFSYVTISKRFLRALRKAELYQEDPGTHRSTITIHGTRTFFRSQLSLGCPLEVVEAMMGHAGYLTGAYRHYSKKQMAELYQKNVHHVCVYSDVNVIEMEREFDRKMKGTSEIVEKLAGDNITLRTRLTEVETRLTDQDTVKQQLASLEELMSTFRDLNKQQPSVS